MRRPLSAHRPVRRRQRAEHAANYGRPHTGTPAGSLLREARSHRWVLRVDAAVVRWRPHQKLTGGGTPRWMGRESVSPCWNSPSSDIDCSWRGIKDLGEFGQLDHGRSPVISLVGRCGSPPPDVRCVGMQGCAAVLAPARRLSGSEASGIPAQTNAAVRPAGSPGR